MQHNIFRVDKKVFDVVRASYLTLSDELNLAILIFQDAMRAGICKDSITYRIACDLKPPLTAAHRMRIAGASPECDHTSFTDYDACFTT